jgi:OOP family OmpA-OmpF porin
MKTTTTLHAAIIATCTLLLTQPACAAGPEDSAYVNPDWANSAWYVGGGLGQSRATIDKERIQRSLTANGANLTSFTTDERDLGFKLFAGKQLNQYLSAEAGYFDLGKFGFASTTSGNGMLRGDAGFRGVNLDLVGQLPLTQRLFLTGRAGMTYARTTTSFDGNRLAAVTNRHASTSKLNPKIGLGLEYKLSEALAVRADVERYRMNDAVGNRGDVDLASLGLVYKFGRPAARPFVAAPQPLVVSEARPDVAAPTPPAVAPTPVSEKVSFAAEALFGFDKAVVKPEGRIALDEMVGKLQGMDTEVMIAVGHTDSVGSNAYNDKLSQRRAEAVKAYLVSKGIESGRLYTEGKGESQPVATNSTVEGRAKNRRVTIEVVGTRTAPR